MMARTRGFVAFVFSVLLNSACGSTTRNDVKSDTSDAGTDTTSAAGNTTGSGGSTTESVTAVGNTGSGTGTGGTTPNDCPSFEPAQGSTCTQANLRCFYENCQAPEYNDAHLLACSDGAWVLSDITTCQTNECPEVAQPGTYCDASVTPGPCSFVDVCGASQEVECVDGSWQAGSAEERAAPGEDPVAPVCPTYPPYLGYPCCPTQVPEICDYTAGTDGAAGASFLINPATSTSGGGAAEPPPSLTCAVCTPDMTWHPCPES